MRDPATTRMLESARMLFLAVLYFSLGALARVLRRVSSITLSAQLTVVQSTLHIYYLQILRLILSMITFLLARLVLVVVLLFILVDSIIINGWPFTFSFIDLYELCQVRFTLSNWVEPARN